LRVFVTGGTGFIGGAVARALVAAGHEVGALVRAGSDTTQLEGLPVARVAGDLRNSDLRPALAGCEWVFHLAALYSYWGHTWDDFFQVNVTGTRRVLQAAWDEGVARVDCTSSVAVLGIPEGSTPGDECTPATLADMGGGYKRSKFLADEVAREFAARGLPVVIVNPSTPVGIGDRRPTPTGRIIVD
jgi:dihydroflavonol-4-reductase